MGLGPSREAWGGAARLSAYLFPQGSLSFHSFRRRAFTQPKTIGRSSCPCCLLIPSPARQRGPALAVVVAYGWRWRWRWLLALQLCPRFALVAPRSSLCTVLCSVWSNERLESILYEAYVVVMQV